VKSVCALVVTYHPWPEVAAHIAVIRAQVDQVVVIDNGSRAEERTVFERLRAQPGVEFIFNPDNRGIAAALNQGVAWALARGFTWIATFDQDSTLPAGFITGLLEAHATAPARDSVALLTPLYRDAEGGTLYSAAGPVDPAAPAVVEVSVAAASGNLVSAAALRDAGGYREDFFIDAVDHEFCLRLRRRGWRVLEVRAVILDHRQGRWERRPLLGRKIGVNDYPATRRYYQARNRLVVYREFGFFDPGWVAHDAWEYTRELIKLILVGTGRGPKIRAIACGVGHALLDRLGPWRT
jgi:rhamnosyltransferase